MTVRRKGCSSDTPTHLLPSPHHLCSYKETMSKKTLAEKERRRKEKEEMEALKRKEQETQPSAPAEKKKKEKEAQEKEPAPEPTKKSEPADKQARDSTGNIF